MLIAISGLCSPSRGAGRNLPSRDQHPSFRSIWQLQRALATETRSRVAGWSHLQRADGPRPSTASSTSSRSSTRRRRLSVRLLQPDATSGIGRRRGEPDNQQDPCSDMHERGTHEDPDNQLLGRQRPDPPAGARSNRRQKLSEKSSTTRHKLHRTQLAKRTPTPPQFRARRCRCRGAARRDR